MPTVRKLTPEEVQELESRRVKKSERERITEQYDQLLSNFNVGDYIEVELDEGDKLMSVHYHLRRAAARRGLALDFKRSSGDVLEFRLSEA